MYKRQALRTVGVLSSILYSGRVIGTDEKQSILGWLRALPLEKYTVLVCAFANWAGTCLLYTSDVYKRQVQEYKNRQKKSISVNLENLWKFELIFFVKTATIASRTQEEIVSCA